MSEITIKNSQTLNAIVASQITEKATYVAVKFNQVAF